MKNSNRKTRSVQKPTQGKSAFDINFGTELNLPIRKVSQKPTRFSTSSKNSKNATTRKKAENVKIIPIGGLDEIGKNMTVLEYKNQILIIDCGMSFPDDGEKDKTDIYMGNGGTPHYVKLYSEGGLGDDGRGSEEDESDNEFAGIWGCERATLKIDDKGEGVFHAVIDWSDSAYAYAEWDYPLIFDGSKLVCDGNASLTYITYKDSSSEPERKLVYSDGKAEFEMKDNCIYWNDLKENRGEGMLFKK